MFLVFFVHVVGQIKSEISGYLLDASDSTGIVDAMVVTSSGTATFTNADGFFTIKVPIPSWIEVIHLNHTGQYEVADLAVKNYHLQLNTFDLAPAEVFYKYNRVVFDKTFTHGELPLDTTAMIKKSLGIHAIPCPPPKATLVNPISYLYEKYSKDAKRKAAFAQVMLLDEQVKTFSYWLSYDRLAQILKTQDTAKINCFFLYCSIDPLWVMHKKEVEIIQEAVWCKETYVYEGTCDWPFELYFPQLAD